MSQPDRQHDPSAAYPYTARPVRCRRYKHGGGRFYVVDEKGVERLLADTYNAEGEMVYGEQHIESKRAATKDAEDLISRLSDGRIWIHPRAGLIHA